MNKKICYVVTIPLTIRAFFIPQIKYLSESGFDVTVVCSCDGSTDQKIIENELNGIVRLHYIDMPRGFSPIASIKPICTLKHFFQKEKFDLIQYSTPNASFYAATAAFLSGCRLRNYHLMGFRYLGEKGVYKTVLKLMEKLTCSLSTSIECVSKSNLELGAKQKVFDKKKAVVVWNGSSGGVDLNRFNIDNRRKWREEMRTRFGYKKTDFIFGFVGRITRDKGINELIEAFLSLDNGTKLFIMGNNEDDSSVNSELWKEAVNSPDVIIHKSSNEVEKYYAMIDVLVLPSYREGFGNVIIEAAALGTPAIATDIPGPRDCIINGKTGLFFSLDEKDGLAASMNKIVSADYTEMSGNARKFVEDNFDGSLLCKKIFERKTLLLKDQLK